MLNFWIIYNPMQEQKSDGRKQALIQQMLELGFAQEYVLKAVSITNNIEIATEIAIKLGDEGPNADLSQYVSIPPQDKNQQKPPGIVVSPYSRAKMLFVVNGELKMGKGKICAQVGHAVVGAYIQIEEEARYDQRAKARLSNWEGAGTPKVVVKADTEKQMLQIRQKLQKLDIGINTYLVQDAGHTQIKAGSQTVLGIGPAFPEQIDPITQHLKLL